MLKAILCRSSAEPFGSFLVVRAESADWIFCWLWLWIGIKENFKQKQNQCRNGRSDCLPVEQLLNSRIIASDPYLPNRWCTLFSTRCTSSKQAIMLIGPFNESNNLHFMKCKGSNPFLCSWNVRTGLWHPPTKDSHKTWEGRTAHLPTHSSLTLRFQNFQICFPY